MRGRSSTRLVPLLGSFVAFAALAPAPVGPAHAQPAATAGTTNPGAVAYQPARYEIHGLAVPAGYEGAVATSIDAEGQVYGYAFNGSDWVTQKRRAVRWHASGHVVKLGPDEVIDGASVGMLDGKPVYWTRVKASPADKVDGFVGDTKVPSFVPKGIRGSRVFGWKYTSTASPGSSGGGFVFPTGESFSSRPILAMNAAGIVVGTANVPSHDVTYRVAYGQVAGVMSTQERFGFLKDVDASGVAVGAVTTVPGDPHAPYHAIRHKPGSVEEDLGTLGGQSSSAHGVTEDGETIVGTSKLGNGLQVAFVRAKRRMYDLNTLVDYPPPPSKPTAPARGAGPGGLQIDPPPTPQMWLRTANGVNDKGDVCGVGISNGKAIPFVLRKKSITGVLVVDADVLKSHIVGRALPALEERPVVEAPGK